MLEWPAELRHQEARLVAIAAIDHPVDFHHRRPSACRKSLRVRGVSFQ
jgi:hypothetical protein